MGRQGLSADSTPGDWPGRCRRTIRVFETTGIEPRAAASKTTDHDGQRVKDARILHQTVGSPATSLQHRRTAPGPGISAPSHDPLFHTLPRHWALKISQNNRSSAIHPCSKLYATWHNQGHDAGLLPTINGVWRQCPAGDSTPVGWDRPAGQRTHPSRPRISDCAVKRLTSPGLRCRDPWANGHYTGPCRGVELVAGLWNQRTKSLWAKRPPGWRDLNRRGYG